MSRLTLVVCVIVVVALGAGRCVPVPYTGGEGTGECSSIYVRYSPNHVMCQKKPDDCHILVSGGLNDTDRETILRLHNHYRNQIAVGNISGLPPSSYMLALEWDDELARVAQASGDLCNRGCFDSDCIHIGKFPIVTGGSHLTLGDCEDNNRDWEVYMESMQDNTNNVTRTWSGAPITRIPGDEGFHILASSANWKIGCGFSMYRSQDTGEHYHKQYTCVYGYGSPYEDDIYEVGKACSDCPEGTCCGASCRKYGFTPSYEGLCTVVGHGPRRAIDEDNLLWTCLFNMDTQRGCRARSEPAGAFVNKTIFTWGYAEAVLQAGQSAELTFEEIIRPSGDSLCAVVEYSKGPDVAGQPDRGLFNLVATPVERPDLQLNINISGSSIYALQHVVNITLDFPLKIGFSFVVPGRSPSQFLQITGVAIYDQACHE